MELLLSAGDVAGRAGVSVQALHYYERVQLLQSLQRSARNHRRYSFETVPRVKFIKKAQALGLSLTKIKIVLELDRKQATRCKAVVELLRAHSAEVESELKRLQELRKNIRRVISQWELVNSIDDRNECGGDYCDLIER